MELYRILIQSFVLITLVLFSACKNKVNIQIKRGPTNTPASRANISSINIANDQVVLIGTNLNHVTNVRVTGANSFDETFTIDAASNNTTLYANASNAINVLAEGLFDLIITDAHGAATFPINISVTDGTVTAAKLSTAGASSGDIYQFNGVNWQLTNLNGASILGTWDANANNPILTDASGNCDGNSNGEYYIVSVAGTTNIDGVNTWNAGDWIFCHNSGAWERIQNGGAVSLFNDLADVDTVSSTPTDGQMLIFKTGSGNWEPSGAITTNTANNNVTFSNDVIISGTGLSVNGTDVCLSDGSNCPAFSTGINNGAGDITLNASTGSDDILLQIGSTTQAKVDDSGNFGIGATNATPATALHVKKDDANLITIDRTDNASISNKFQIGSADNGSADILTIGSDTTANSLSIDENGNVGIGTNSPSHLFTIEKNQPAVTSGMIKNTNASGRALLEFENDLGQGFVGMAGSTDTLNSSRFQNRLVLSSNAVAFSAGTENFIWFNKGYSSSGYESMRLERAAGDGDSRLGIGTGYNATDSGDFNNYIPPYNLTLGAYSNTNRSIGVERQVHPSIFGGRSLTINAGGAADGESDINGGDLILASGTATGTGTSGIQFQTATAQGATNTTDNAPTTKMTITGAGKIGLGITTPDASTIFHSQNDGKGYIRSDVYREHVYGGGLDIRHARGTIAAPIKLNQNDMMSVLYARGYDGSTFIEGSYIASVVDNVPSAGSLAGRLDFATRQAGWGFSDVKMTIKSEGNIGIGTQTPDVRTVITKGALCVSSDANCDGNNDNEGEIHAEKICDETGTNCQDISAGWGGTGDLMSDGTITMTAPLKHADGTAALPSLTFGTDLDTGIFSDAGDELNFSTNGVERMTISSNGTLGLGAPSPTYSLDILQDNYQQIRSIRDNSTGTAVWSNDLYSTTSFGPTFQTQLARGSIASPLAITTGTHFLQLVGKGHDGTAFQQSARIYMTSSENWTSGATGSKLGFYTTANGSSSPSENLTILDNGNVGIGVTTPTEELDVAGDIKATTVTTSNNIYASATVYGQAGIRDLSDNGTGFLFPVNGQVSIDISGSEALRIDPSRNVGIGISAPEENLHIQGDGTTGINDIMILGTLGNSGNGRGTGLLFKTPGAASSVKGARIAAEGDGGVALSFHTSPDYLDTDPTEKVRISSSGDMGIGTTSPGSKLHVDGGGICVTDDNSCDVLPGAGGISSKTAAVTGADYAEYFEAQEKMRPGDVVGLDPQSGKAKLYQPGDQLLGIISTAPGIVGNSTLNNDNAVLVALLGQVPVNSEQIQMDNGLVKTLDQKVIGFQLASGDVYLNISTSSESLIKEISHLKQKALKQSELIGQQEKEMARLEHRLKEQEKKFSDEIHKIKSILGL